MNKRILTGGILLACVLLLLGSMYVLSMKQPEEISRIEIDVGGFRPVHDSYVVDFASHTVVHELKDGLGSLEAYDYETTRLEAAFTDEQAQQFLRTANLYHMFGWKANYEDPNVLDGYWETISICYTDGTVQTIRCQNKRPPFYGKVMESFDECFGNAVAFS